MKYRCNRFIISIATSLCLFIPALGIEFRVPPGLEVFSLMNVLEVQQDKQGAIWMNTTRGLYRYNGHSLEKLSEELPRRSLECTGGEYLYALRQDDILCLDVMNLTSSSIPLEDAPSYFADSPQSSSLHSSDGRVFSSLGDGGFRVERADGSYRDYLHCDGRSINVVRGFVEMEGGVVYIGTANGLFSFDASGRLRSESVSFIESCPVCCLFKDRDGCLWVGTYHNGVFVSSPSAFPLHTVDTGLRGMMTNATVRDSKGKVFIFTDGQGVLEYDPCLAKLSSLPSFPSLKYQGAFYDPVSDRIWTTAFHEGLKCFSANGKQLNTFRFSSSLVQGIETITPICRAGMELLIGGAGGLYAFDPASERVISRRIDGIEGLVYSFAKGPDDAIWIAANGVYQYSEGSVKKVLIGQDPQSWENTQQCYSIDFSPDGGVWIGYARKGAILLRPDGHSYFNSSYSGLQDDYTYAICALPDGDAVVSTATGLSVIGETVINYPSAMVDAIQRIDESRLLLCTRDGVMMYDAASSCAGSGIHGVRIDGVLIDGERFSGHDMSHDQNNIIFDISTCSYSPHSPLAFTTILEGYDKAQTRSNTESPVLYRKLPKGRYTFRVTAWWPDGRVHSQDSYIFRIHPPWYSTNAAKIGMALLFLLISGILFASFNARRRLSSALKKEEEENRERTRFFIDLSNKIRTPLNLIVGKLERYFKDFGSRSSGSENIEDIYLKSRELRRMVSDFVDSQNEMVVEAEADGSGTEIVKDAKFYNAAIGAVERNLFSPDLDVNFLCREMNVGKTMLTQRLKQSSGMTPRVFIESVRLEHAAEMLRQGTHRVSEIADLLCFCSPKHFSERFRLKYGCNPSAYK